jgi:hypothetical protein
LYLADPNELANGDFPSEDDSPHVFWLLLATAHLPFSAFHVPLSFV